MGLFNSIKIGFSAAYDSIMEGRASKGVVRQANFSSSGQRDARSGQPSPSNLDLALEHYRLDPVVQGAITTRADSITVSGWTNKGSSQEVVDNANKRLKSYGFDFNYVYQVVINALLYDNFFLEVERTNAGNPTEVHLLEAPYMEIRHTKHGEIENFIERGETGEVVLFPPEDVVFGSMNRVTTAVWGELGLKSIYRSLGTKNQIEKFINALAIMNSWRQVLKTTMTDIEIEDYLAYYMDASADATQPFVMQIQKKAGTDLKDDNYFELLRNPKDLNDFQTTLNYFRTQALMYLKTPPILVGLPDNSNRSSSDAQFRAYNIANESFRKKIKTFFDELYKKLGLGNVEFVWNPIDERAEREDIDIAEKLMNMGADPEQVEEFLRDAGLELPDGKVLKKEVPVTKSEDQFPSRKRKTEGETSKVIGTGEQSSTRPDQL